MPSSEKSLVDEARSPTESGRSRFTIGLRQIGWSIFGLAMLTRVIIGLGDDRGGEPWWLYPEFKGVVTGVLIFGPLIGALSWFSFLRLRRLRQRHPRALVIPFALHAEGLTGLLRRLGAEPSPSGKFSNPLSLVVSVEGVFVYTGMWLKTRQSLFVSRENIQDVSVRKGILDVKGQGLCLVFTIRAVEEPMTLWIQPQSARFLMLASESSRRLAEMQLTAKELLALEPRGEHRDRGRHL